MILIPLYVGFTMIYQPGEVCKISEIGIARLLNFSIILVIFIISEHTLIVILMVDKYSGCVLFVVKNTLLNSVKIVW